MAPERLRLAGRKRVEYFRYLAMRNAGKLALQRLTARVRLSSNTNISEVLSDNYVIIGRHFNELVTRRDIPPQLLLKAPDR